MHTENPREKVRQEMKSGRRVERNRSRTYTSFRRFLDSSIAQANSRLLCRSAASRRACCQATTDDAHHERAATSFRSSRCGSELRGPTVRTSDRNGRMAAELRKPVGLNNQSG